MKQRMQEINTGQHEQGPAGHTEGKVQARKQGCVAW